MTANRTANAIMQDTTFDGTYLIVEGMKDYKLYRKFFNVNNQVEIKQVGGKEKVQKVIEILNEREFNKVIGIIDSDFSKILGNELEIDNIFSTDFHDIEVTMFQSPALETILNMYITKEKLETFLNGKEIREILINLAKQIGLLKLANHIYDLGLAFKPKNLDGKNLKYKDFIDDKTLNYKGKTNLIQTVRNYSFNRGDNVAEMTLIEEKMDELLHKEHELLQLVNGHDLSNIIFMLLKKVLGSTNKSLFDYNTVEDSLIMSYETRYWIKTELFDQLYEWAKLNDENIFREDINELYRLLKPVEI